MSFACVSSAASQCRVVPTVGRSASRTARNATAAPHHPPQTSRHHQNLALQPRQRSSRAVVLRAQTEDETTPTGETPAAAPATAEDDEEVKGAQMTAIVTGVFSVVLAVGYLALVQVMDSREMLPPPPEAMGMGDVR